jgi:class 3 adenylate cyclase
MVPPGAEETAAPEAEDDAERRIVSVMFADLSGSLRLIRGLDPEDARDLLDAALERMKTAVTRFGGVVAQTLGDGLMALFGAGSGQEDHATSACRAALALTESLRTPIAGRTLNARVGLHAGEVLLRTGQSAAEGALRAVGEAVHVAARIQASAESGSVRASMALCRLAGLGITLRPLGPVRLRGAAGAIDLAEVLAVPAGPLARRAAVPILTPLVNRGHELGVLAAALDSIREGAGRAVVLVGEPGSGKSRLVRECALAAQARGIAVHLVGCAADGAAIGYQPLLPLLRRLLALDDAAEVDAAGLARALTALGANSDLQESVGALAALLGRPDDAWKGLSALDRSRRLASALRALVGAAARRTPMLLVVEDIHWADAESLGLFSAVAEDSGSLPLLLLATRRPEGAPPWPDLTHGLTLPVNLLSGADAVRLTELLLGQDAAASGLAGLLTDRAGGNPFFAEELVASLAERGVISGAAGDWHVEAEAEAASVPATVRGLLTARLSLLAAPDRRLLEAAAVLGREFDAALLSGMVAAGVAEPPDAALTRLAAAQFVVAGADPGRWAFRHALTQEAVLAGLSRVRRRKLHAAALAVLTGLPEGPERTPETLARHAWGAGEWLLAAQHARAAAEAAFARYANGTAVEFFDQAIAAAARAGDAPEVLRLGLDLRIRQRDALFRLGRTKQVRTRLEEAEKLAARDDVADLPRRAQVALLQAHINWLTGRYRHATAAIDRADAIQATLRDPHLALRISYERAAVAMAIGDLDAAATEMLGVSQAILSAPPKPGRYGVDASLAATAASYAARCWSELGWAAASARAAIVSTTAAKHWAQPFPRIFEAMARAAAAIAANDPLAAAACIAEAGQAIDAADAQLMRPPVLMLAGQLAIRTNDGTAVDLFKQSALLAESSGMIVQQSWRLAQLAGALLACGKTADARSMALRAKHLSAIRNERQPVNLVRMVLAATNKE